jgi:hypothetical protein
MPFPFDSVFQTELRGQRIRQRDAPGKSPTWEDFFSVGDGGGGGAENWPLRQA